MLWGEIRTQWRSSGFGLIGLDYGAVKSEARRIGIELTSSMMSKVKVLEREVLSSQTKGKSDG